MTTAWNKAVVVRHPKLKHNHPILIASIFGFFLIMFKYIFATIPWKHIFAENHYLDHNFKKTVMTTAWYKVVVIRHPKLKHNHSIVIVSIIGFFSSCLDIYLHQYPESIFSLKITIRS